MYALKVIIPLVFILGLYLYIKSKSKPKIEEKPLRRPEPIKDTFNLEAYRATLSECENYLDNEKQIRQEADLRQFQDRTDVTKEELARYMFEQRRWDGIHERRLQMEEIIKVCNLTLADIRWVEEELKHYHTEGNAIVDNRCCYVRNEEEKAVWEYENEQEMSRLKTEIPKIENDFQKHLAFHKELGFSDEVINAYEEDHKALMNSYESTIRQCDYDLWLTMKGYVKNE